MLADVITQETDTPPAGTYLAVRVKIASTSEADLRHLRIRASATHVSRYESFEKYFKAHKNIGNEMIAAGIIGGHDESTSIDYVISGYEAHQNTHPSFING